MESYLLPGERILWEGAPVRRRLFRATDAALVPFSTVFAAFAIFWVIGVLSEGARLFSVFGVLFVVMAFYLLAGRFVVRALAAPHTTYTITDRRVVVRGGLTGRRLTTAYLKALPPPVIDEQQDGSGNLAFGGFPTVGDVFNGGRRNGFRPWSAEPSDTPVLWDVADVRRVRDFVAHVQAAG
ncbi:hypothetical protein [Actinoplanes sp. CA-252034]|uniref:hypothetical protein n=1 Tax=Actinoplanes sp. CA-252034 TaxID=3239906 RepID=UPI003D9558FE